MTDQLFLSVWLERAQRDELRRHYAAMLARFPFSQQPKQQQSTFSILAVSATEAPLLERMLPSPVSLEALSDLLQEYSGPDVAYQLETWWDLWQYSEGEWNLRPARVLLSCFGPEFDNGSSASLDQQEDLRVDFGVDSHYLPQAELPGSARLIESNIRSLLRVVREIESSIPVARRLLGTETGQNFAERLQQQLAGSTEGFVH